MTGGQRIHVLVPDASPPPANEAIVANRMSCGSFAANAVRLQLHALAYNLANFMRTSAPPEAVKHWSRTSLRENS